MTIVMMILTESPENGPGIARDCLAILFDQ
jgi:hypothetical protein